MLYYNTLDVPVWAPYPRFFLLGYSLAYVSEVSDASVVRLDFSPTRETKLLPFLLFCLDLAEAGNTTSAQCSVTLDPPSACSLSMNAWSSSDILSIFKVFFTNTATALPGASWIEFGLIWYSFESAVLAQWHQHHDWQLCLVGEGGESDHSVSRKFGFTPLPWLQPTLLWCPCFSTKP